MSEIEQIAAGFVEATTQYDYAQLPDHLKTALIEAATEFSRWMNAQGVYRIEPGRMTQETIGG